MTASTDVLPGGNRAMMETAQGDLGEASGYGMVRSRRNVARTAEFAENERLRQFEQRARQREQAIIENDKNILNAMSSAYDANIHAAAEEVRMLRDREQRANMQLGHERLQAAGQIAALREQARSSERRSQVAIPNIQQNAQRMLAIFRPLPKHEFYKFTRMRS